jgi:hypothetical protein
LLECQQLQSMHRASLSWKRPLVLSSCWQHASWTGRPAQHRTWRPARLWERERRCRQQDGGPRVSDTASERTQQSKCDGTQATDRAAARRPLDRAVGALIREWATSKVLFCSARKKATNGKRSMQKGKRVIPKERSERRRKKNQRLQRDDGSRFGNSIPAPTVDAAHTIYVAAAVSTEHSASCRHIPCRAHSIASSLTTSLQKQRISLTRLAIPPWPHSLGGLPTRWFILACGGIT